MSKRIFTSFAVEDTNLRDMLIGQARKENCPIELVDMSVKVPWDSEWKTKCRTKIKGCDGVIAIITKNTKNAAGQLWEIKCAREEGIPCIGIYVDQDSYYYTSYLPTEMQGNRVIRWTWNGISSWIDSIKDRSTIGSW